MLFRLKDSFRLGLLLPATELKGLVLGPLSPLPESARAVEKTRLTLVQAVVCSFRRSKTQ